MNGTTNDESLNDCTTDMDKKSDSEQHEILLSDNVVPGNLVNGKTLSPKKLSPKQSDNLSPKKTIDDKIVDSSSVHKSPEKNKSKNSPLKNKSAGVLDNSPCRSPAKMIASNQIIDESNTLLSQNNDFDSSAEVPDHIQLSRVDNLKRRLSICDSINVSDRSFSVNETDKDVPENSETYAEKPNTSPDMFEGDSTSYLNSRKNRRRCNELISNSNKSKVSRRSQSPDAEEFSKICDELCNELPKIEKVKRLRFSFENFADDLQFNVKTKRKKFTRTPRKSSLLPNKNSKTVIRPEFKRQDLFSKYIDIWVSNFSLSDVSDYLGWEDYYDKFTGWPDTEVTEAKKYKASFSDFLFKCNENSEDNGWAGWEDVSRRSLVLNGFLLEEISRNPKISDFDGESDVSEEFVGFQQNVKF